MNDFEQQLEQELADIANAGLRRELRRLDSAQSPLLRHSAADLLSFSSNDYLGLANHPALKNAAVDAIGRYGAGSGASRLISGSLAPHHELEETLASFKRTEAALSFSTGYAAAVGTISALMAKDDVIVLDKLVHASIVDASRLSGAKLRIFKHNDLTNLEDILRWASERKLEAAGKKSRTLVVTESVFSMDGDVAPLSEIVELKDRYGAWLMVDEAHATGLFGHGRRGVAEAAGVSNRIEIQMGTLGKAVGSGGGYICGSRKLTDFLVNRARSFIFSTAPPPAQSAAATAGINLIQSSEGEQRCAQVWSLVAQIREALASLGPIPAQSAIIPLIIGSEERAVECATRLRQSGIYIPAIRYPTVARGAARLRVTVTASHTGAEVRRLAETLLATFEPTTP